MKKPLFGVIASMTETSSIQFTLALARAGTAQSIEVRLDCAGDRSEEILELLPLLSTTQAFILTLRSKEQGGRIAISPERQWNFWANLPEKLAALVAKTGTHFFVDWGLDLFEYHRTHEKRQLFPWCKIGASWHDFEETPQDVPEMLAELEALPAQAFLKLATFANAPQDISRIQALFHNRIDPRPLIAFAMGEHGEQSRRQCLSWGSAGTYGYVPGRAKSAPGQLSIIRLLSDPSVQATLGY